MRTSKFYEAAEHISSNLRYDHGCCYALAKMDGQNYIGNSKSAQYFKDLFHPSYSDMDDYQINRTYWMRPSCEYKINEVNNFRILALLLCNEIYLSETK